MIHIDLSVDINENTPVYPGDPKTKIQQGGILEKNGYQDHYLCIGTHVGTHIDAPSHMIKNGKNLNEIALEQFFGNGIVINIDKKFDMEIIKKAPIKKRDIVLFNTGMSRSYHRSAYYDNYPAITEEIAQYLVDKKIKMVGVDMCSVDYEPFPVHKTLLKNNILIIENLTNLTQLKGKEFMIYAFPIKLQIDGAPARVIAEVIKS